MTKILLAASSYEHLKFYNRIMTLKTVVIGVYIGFLVGIVISYYNKVYLGRFVRKLTQSGALSPETAQSVRQLKMRATPFLKRSLIKNRALSRVVAHTDEGVTYTERKSGSKKLRRFFGMETSPKAAYDFDKVRFYIPEEEKYAAEARYDKKSPGVLALVLLLAALTAAAVLVYIEVPELLTMLDNFLSIVIDN